MNAPGNDKVSLSLKAIANELEEIDATVPVMTKDGDADTAIELLQTVRAGKDVTSNYCVLQRVIKTRARSRCMFC